MKRFSFIFVFILLFFCFIFPVSAAEYDENFDVFINIDDTKSTVLTTYEQRYYAIPHGYEHFFAYYDDFSSEYRICFYSGEFKFGTLDSSDEYYWDYFYTHNGFYADNLTVYSFKNVEDLELYLTNSYDGEIVVSGTGTYTRTPCSLSKFYFTDQTLYFRVSQHGAGSKYDYFNVNDPVNYDYYLVRQSVGHYDFVTLIDEIINIFVIIIPVLISIFAFRKSWKFLISIIRSS